MINKYHLIFKTTNAYRYLKCLYAFGDNYKISWFETLGFNDPTSIMALEYLLREKYITSFSGVVKNGGTYSITLKGMWLYYCIQSLFSDKQLIKYDPYIVIKR